MPDEMRYTDSVGESRFLKQNFFGGRDQKLNSFGFLVWSSILHLLFIFRSSLTYTDSV
jgi:hypothetical protein